MKIFSSSPRGDLQKISKLTLQDVINELKVINSNVLYVTYQVDKLKAKQQTLDAREYYGPDNDNPEANPATDSDN